MPDLIDVIKKVNLAVNQIKKEKSGHE